ncbi:MAG: DUF2911 domain-containing protein, partial [Bacteroidota bacterium]|nr:DUF2911 domain-containing protein [Bacteroidota bacterium]
MNKPALLLISLIACFLYSITTASSQSSIKRLDQSQKVSITQQIGITDITIVYHSPLVDGRMVWDSMVPYGSVWRAGANENTTIAFSNPVILEGQALGAGTYGLHMITGKDEWTIIFSKTSTAWGSYTYKQEDDALRVKVKAMETPFQNWLSYTFMDPRPSVVAIALTWEKVRVAFEVTMDVDKQVLDHFRRKFSSEDSLSWQTWYMAANYCYTQDIHPEEAMEWVNESIRVMENFTNLSLKHGLLTQRGDSDAAKPVLDKALEYATEEEINAYGYTLMGLGKTNDALAIFELNVKRYPDGWNVYDSLAECLAAKNDKKAALKYYKMALKKAPEDKRG